MKNKSYLYFFYSLFFLGLFFPVESTAKIMHLHPVGAGVQHDNHYYGLWQITSVSPGDIIYCYDDDGVYTNSFLLERWRGTAEKPIIIMNAPGEQPIIKGYIDIQNSQYLEIKGLTVTESPYGAIMIQKGSHHITVAECIVKNNGLGIWIANGAGMANRILQNSIFSNKTHGIAAALVNCSPGNETIMAENHVYDNGYMGFEINGSYYIIEKNVVHDNGKDYVGTSGIHLFSLNPGENTGDNNIIRYNISYNNIELNGPDGNGIQLDQWCDNNEVYYNLCYHNDGAGINIFDSAGNKVYNNTLAGNMIDPGSSHLLKAELTLASQYTKGIDATRDNILVNNLVVSTIPSVATIYIDAMTADNQLNIRRNLLFHQKEASLYVWNNLEGKTIASFNSISGHSENLSQDPLFVTQVPQGTYDFLLREGSPAVDQGIALGQTQDILGKPISGAGPDIGAFEADSSSLPSDKSLKNEGK